MMAQHSMTLRKVFWSIAAWVAMLALPVFLLTANLRLVTDSPWLYQYGFPAFDSPGRTGLPLEELLSAASHTRRYFNSNEEPLNVMVDKGGIQAPLYNDREIKHMADVKQIFRLAQRVEEVSSAYLLAFAGAGLWLLKRRFLPDLFWAATSGGLLTVALVIIAGAGALVDFDRLFIEFHLLSFSNDLWQLDPRRDYLIMMYPEGFFQAAALVIAALSFTEGAGIATVAWAAGARLRTPTPTNRAPSVSEGPTG